MSSIWPTASSNFVSMAFELWKEKIIYNSKSVYFGRNTFFFSNINVVLHVMTLYLEMAKSSSGKANSIGSIPSTMIVNFTKIVVSTGILFFFKYLMKVDRKQTDLPSQFPKQTYFTILRIAHNTEVSCNHPKSPLHLKIQKISIYNVYKT